MKKFEGANLAFSRGTILPTLVPDGDSPCGAGVAILNRHLGEGGEDLWDGVCRGAVCPAPQLSAGLCNKTREKHAHHSR